MNSFHNLFGIRISVRAENAQKVGVRVDTDKREGDSQRQETGEDAHECLLTWSRHY